MTSRLDAAGWLWAAVAVVALEIWVTYARLPADALYHVTGSGFRAGASRVLVFLCFPVALVAIAIVLELYGRLERRLRPVAVGAIALCLVVVWPGVVSEGNLDAKPVNALPAAGVGIAFALWLVAARGRPPRLTRTGIVAAAVALVVALPWLAAELGFFLPGSIYLTAKRLDGVPAVHHGHHHGIDGLLLVACALLLWPAAGRGLRLWLAVMLPYGLMNTANDAWSEQVVKRGWTGRQLPNVLVPTLSVGWLVIVVAAVAIYAMTSTPRSASGFADSSS